MLGYRQIAYRPLRCSLPIHRPSRPIASQIAPLLRPSWTSSATNWTATSPHTSFICRITAGASTTNLNNEKDKKNLRNRLVTHVQVRGMHNADYTTLIGVVNMSVCNYPQITRTGKSRNDKGWVSEAYKWKKERSSWNLRTQSFRLLRTVGAGSNNDNVKHPRFPFSLSVINALSY